MTRKHANLLRAFSVWTVFVWVTRMRNIWGDDHSTSFKLIHSALALVSIVFAIACWWVVTQNRGRNVGQREAESEQRKISDAAKRAASDLDAKKEQRL
jgi:hypothetical protein